MAEAVDAQRLVVWLLIILAVLAGVSASVFGSTFYAGLLDKVVGEHHYGHEYLTLGEVLRRLPYGRLVAVMHR